MVRKSIAEILVGLFMIVGVIALIFLAFRVSGLTEYSDRHHYVVYADFDNIGDLKVRAPVTVGGVRIGQVSNITLNSNTFRARASLNINDKFNNIPTDSTAVILTQGLLGSNYISLVPGFDSTVMKNGDQIETTRSAIILENLIGQFLLNMKGDSKESDKKESDKKETQ